MIWWWVASAVLFLVVIPVVVILANRLVTVVAEIRDYAADIRAHGMEVSKHLEPIPALATTAQLLSAAREPAAAHAARVKQVLEEQEP